MNKLCDLHTHSVFSDGTFTPAEIIDEAIRIGLSAVALCDHNTVDGLPEFLSAAEGKDIEAVAGAEFSVDLNGTELHLLGLFIPSSRFAEISEKMLEVNMRKEQSNLELIASLSRAGIHVDYESLKKSTPNGKINRAHIAGELVRLGYVSSRGEAFDTVLSPEAGHYKEPKRLGVFEMIDYLRSIGALPVLAHPYLKNDERGLINDFLPRAASCGLVGMECYYSTYDDDTTHTALDTAKRLGLLPSGGSDFHGERKPDIQIGTGRGTLGVPTEFFEKLRDF